MTLSWSNSRLVEAETLILRYTGGLSVLPSADDSSRTSVIRMIRSGGGSMVEVCTVHSDVDKYRELDALRFRGGRGMTDGGKFLPGRSVEEL